MTVDHEGISLIEMYHCTVPSGDDFEHVYQDPCFLLQRLSLNHLGFPAVVARFESYDTQGWLTLGCLCPLVGCVVNVQVETIFGLSNSARCLTQSLGYAHCL